FLIRRMVQRIPRGTRGIATSSTSSSPPPPTEIKTSSLEKFGTVSGALLAGTAASYVVIDESKGSPGKYDLVVSAAYGSMVGGVLGRCMPWAPVVILSTTATGFVIWNMYHPDRFSEY